jgi:Ni/Co efflux regulator RcnB
MKKLLLIVAIVAFSLGMSAQDQMAAKADTTKSKCELKEHVCTSACKDGKHVYAHGEKGHVCTDACKKAQQ